MDKKFKIGDIVIPYYINYSCNNYLTVIGYDGIFYICKEEGRPSSLFFESEIRIDKIKNREIKINKIINESSLY